MKQLVEGIQRVGLVVNPDKPGGRAALRQASRLIRAAGRQVLSEPVTADMAGFKVPRCGTRAELAAACDLLVVFGGDGTILRVARETAGHSTPMLGINLGRLGFLSATSAKRLAAALRQVWDGMCFVEVRSMLEADAGDRKPALREVALNDFVITRGRVPRLIELEVEIDGEELTRYRGDGLIVSSPTGSTAYSLAAGGAVVTPEANVIALTPICPHTLSSRSVIISLDSVVRVKVGSKKVETLLAADGQMRGKVFAGDVLTFRKSQHSAHLVRLPSTSFFETLRQKLKWSGSSV